MERAGDRPPPIIHAARAQITIPTHRHLLFTVNSEFGGKKMMLLLAAGPLGVYRFEVERPVGRCSGGWEG
ncbi:MAG: hypothetical protein ABSF83_07435 [Nitrososphaerales archaeon]|jgi:hypothetical protein